MTKDGSKQQKIVASVIFPLSYASGSGIPVPTTKIVIFKTIGSKVSESSAVLQQWPLLLQELNIRGWNPQCISFSSSL
jgi:hypothetical protein